MSADIIQFIPRSPRNRGQTDFPTIAFRSTPRRDNLAMDHVDTSPCEYRWPDECDPVPSDSFCVSQATKLRQESAVDRGESRADEGEAREMSGIEMFPQPKRPH